MNVEIGHRPDLDADELLSILQDRLGDRFEVYKPGRFQVPDVMVRASEEEGAAVQIVQRPLHKSTKLRVYGLAPSVAQRGFTPYGLKRQAEETRPLVDQVVEALKADLRLQPP